MEEKVFMVEFEIPVLTQEMMALIPRQRHVISQFMLEKKVTNYSIASDRSRLWVIFSVQNKSELIHLIQALPMTPYMKYIYTELLFHNMLQIVPNSSLN